MFVTSRHFALRVIWLHNLASFWTCAWLSRLMSLGNNSLYSLVSFQIVDMDRKRNGFGGGRLAGRQDRTVKV